MPSFSTISAIRFGTGISPTEQAPDTTADILERLSGPDPVAAQFPITPFKARLETAGTFFRLKKAVGSAGKEGRRAFSDHKKAMRIATLSDRVNTIGRAVYSRDGFRERLCMFWADHFSTRARVSHFSGIVASYVNEAIRPHVAGRFADMLRAAVLHPVMLIYLDQPDSFGPNSALGIKRGKGLNENLAREVIELHTLGVDGAYDQQDVRQLALLFTGLSADLRRGFLFRAKMAEPGAETVLGKRYGGEGKARLDDIHAVLEDISMHPDTARHIAWKLAVHFVADDPSPALVADIAQGYLAADGSLMGAYAALLDHFDAWDSFGQKARRPDEFVIATLRALNEPAAHLGDFTLKSARDLVFGPMAAMGLKWEEPKGPDGWPERADAWITPQGLAARIQWAMAAPRAILPQLPDPRDFVDRALGDAASDATRHAAAEAATRWEGVGLVLASPEFNRR